MKLRKLIQPFLCRLPFSPWYFFHDRLLIVQRMEPTGSYVVQCQSCGRLFGMNDNVKCILPVSAEMMEMYQSHGNKLKHVDSKHCWCEPELDHVDPDNGNEVWVHRDIM